MLYKYHPDFGYQSFAYDKLGNLRFSQTEEQFENNELVFYEYDDLNRLTLFGIAYLNEGGYTDPEEINGEMVFNRVTDGLDPNILHDGGQSEILTSNKTMFECRLYDKVYDPYIDKPLETGALEATTEVPALYSLVNSTLNYSYVPEPGNMLYHNIEQYDDRTTWAVKASLGGFEHLTWYTNHPRTVYYYDEMPPVKGTIWGFYAKA